MEEVSASSLVDLIAMPIHVLLSKKYTRNAVNMHNAESTILEEDIFTPPMGTKTSEKYECAVLGVGFQTINIKV
jgi:hypothetical protein